MYDHEAVVAQIMGTESKLRLVHTHGPDCNFIVRKLPYYTTDATPKELQACLKEWQVDDVEPVDDIGYYNTLCYAQVNDKLIIYGKDRLDHPRKPTSCLLHYATRATLRPLVVEEQVYPEQVYPEQSFASPVYQVSSPEYVGV